MNQSRRIARGRLLKLVARLRRVKPTHFDMGGWAASRYPCQTAGCAVGYATIIPSFRRAGLRLKSIGADLNGTCLPVYKNYSSWSAVREFFRLSESESWELFSRNEYENATLQNVTRRIDAFAKQLT